MKKAKQILSLMLVIAMALGMMVFVPGTASAKNVGDYPDADEIEYKEAVDVLSALGVLLGDDSGSFNPKSNITREQAAKIITYILIGTTAADRLAPRTSSFTDVDTGRWSNPYIEYCVEKGIIKGYGDGRFGPADSVTSSQMAKMLLMCIGYGAVGEYDNGDSWELNTIVDGQRRGILDIDKDFTQPASREEVALYTFNALTEDDAFLVSYSELAKEYLPRGSSIFTAVSQTYLGAETFSLIETGDVDALGYDVRIWKLDKYSNAVAITGAYRSDKTLGRSSDGTEIIGTGFSAGSGLADLGSFFLKAQLKTYTVGYYNNAGVYITQEIPLDTYINGVLQAKSYTQAELDAGLFATSDANVESAKRGVIVELVDRDNDGHADKIVIIKKTISVVTSNPTVNSMGTATINGVLNNMGGYTFTTGKVEYPAELKANDVVLYYRDNNKTGGVTHIEIAKSVTGEMQAYKPNAFATKYSAITLSGTDYYPTNLSLSSTLPNPYESFISYAENTNYFNYGAIAYLDDGGSIIAITPEDEGILDYLVLLGMESLNYAAQAAVVLSDATYRMITIDSLTVGTNVYVTSKDIKDQIELAGNAGTIYAYSVNSDGTYALRVVTNGTIPAGNAVSQKATFATGTYSVNPAYGFTGDATTIFIVETTTPVTSYRIYTGVSNAPVYDALPNSAAVAVNSSNVAKFVFLRGTPKTLQTNTLVFYSISSFAEEKIDGVMTYLYDVVDPDGADAVTRKVRVSAAVHTALGNYYKEVGGRNYSAVQAAVGYNSAGTVVGISLPSMVGAGKGDPEGTMFEHFYIHSNNGKDVVVFGATGANAYRYNSNTEVFILTGDMWVPVVRASMSDIVKDPNAIVTGRVAEDSNGPTDLITELYVTRRTAPVAAGSIVTGVMPASVAAGHTLADALAFATITPSYDNGVTSSTGTPVLNYVLLDGAFTFYAPETVLTAAHNGLVLSVYDGMTKLGEVTLVVGA